MRIMNRLAIKDLWRTRRRTLLTVLGIAVTVALLSCAFHFFTSYQEMMRQEIVARTGLWHVQYGGVDADSFKTIAADGNTAGWFVRQDAFTFVGTSTRLSITELSPSVIPDMKLTLVSGRLPQAPGEVAVTRLYSGLYPVGETIAVEAGRRMEPDELLEPGDEVLHADAMEKYIKTSLRTYTVVGIVEPIQNNYGFAPIAELYAVFDESAFRPGETASMFVENRQVWGGVEQDALALAERAGLPYYLDPDGSKQYSIGYNGELLMSYGVTGRQGSTDMIVWMVLVFILVVMAAGIALIYNAFAISVSEKTRQLGMLASVGATRRQRRRMVYFEGLLQAVAGILLGLLLGLSISLGVVTVADAILNGLSFAQYHLTLVISLLAMAATALLGAVTVFLAVLVPALRAGRLAPIDAIRQSRDVKLTRKGVKTGRLTDRLLRFPERLGLKSLKRNRKRYRITAISLSISIVLFLTTSSYLFYARKAIAMEDTTPSYDVLIQAPGYLSGLDIAGMKASLSVGFERGVWNLRDSGGAFLTREQYDESYVATWGEGPDVSQPMWFSVCTADARSLNEFLQRAGITERPAWNGGQPTAILLNGGVLTGEDGRPAEVRFTTLQPGDTLPLYNFLQMDQKDYTESNVTVSIAAVTTAWPENPAWDISREGGPTLLVTEETIAALLKGYRPPGSAQGLYIVKEHEQFCKDVRAYTKDGARFAAIDMAAMRESKERMLLAVGIGAYSFVGLITLLCAINMFGTLSTSMNLRRRELAMLKSVGMTKGAIRRMLAFESLCYGLKALAVGLPVSLVLDVLLYRLMQFGYVTRFSFPWVDFLLVTAATLLLTWLFMLAAPRVCRRQNIVDELRSEP